MSQKALNKAGGFLYRNSSTILTIIGTIGVVATAVMAVRATPKASRDLDRATYEKGEELSKLEIVRVAGPTYIPTVVMGTATIACIFGANVLNKRKQASMMSAYALMDRSFKEYRSKLIELKGEDVDKEVRDAVVREHCDYHVINLDVPDKKVKFYEEYSGRFIECYERDLIDAEYHLNRNFVLNGYASLNDFYEFVGLSPTDDGEKLGWTAVDGYCWIDFAHHAVKRKDGSVKHYAIIAIFPPEEDFMEGWE